MIDVTVILGVFFVVLDKKSELLCCFIEMSSEICKAGKEHVRTCKDYVIGREITTLLKIAVDNIILELCGSCDCFAGPLPMEKKPLNLIMIFKKETHPEESSRLRPLRHWRFHNS